MIVIYANSFSSPCNKVRYACELIGVPYEWKHLDFASGDHKTPAHLARHPAGKIPVIDDDGFILWESDAICRYLDAKYDGTLIPDDLQRAALVNQWNAYTTQHVANAVSKVAYNRIIAPKFGLPVFEDSLNEGLDWLHNRQLPIIDRQLEHHTHLAGDDISLADISLLSTLDMAEIAEISLDAFSHLLRWRSTLQARPFWLASHAETA